MNAEVLEHLKPLLRGKRILLGISGSIAACKSSDIIRFLRLAGAEVKCLLTDSAQQFVTPLSLETLSGNPVGVSLWDSSGKGTHHIESARWADLFLVAPATANTIAKLALGFADDLLSTEALAFNGPRLLCPAMNPSMWAHPAVQANAEKLRSYGYRLVGPELGRMACGEEGYGRMTEPEQILPEIATEFRPLAIQTKILITLGPTRSQLDPVRYISNRSSGKMGAALAWAAWRRGYSVSVIQGPVDVGLPPQTEVIRVHTAEEMLKAASEEWRKNTRVFISAAAVLDWDVANPASGKLKKGQDSPFSNLQFRENADILKHISELAKVQRRSEPEKPAPFVLGFAAETTIERGQIQKKFEAKGCDAMFVNDVSDSEQGFESDNNSGMWIDATSEELLPRCSKRELAESLIKKIENKLLCEGLTEDPIAHSSALTPPPLVRVDRLLN